VANPLLVFWSRIFGRGEDERFRRLRRLQFASAAEASETIFIVLRRMRVPLIVLITILAVTVLGLTLIPGQDPEGRPYRMGFFDAFYVMSYTASTIGFGELPYPFTYSQRMWVTISIYLTVIGWAYAIGSLLALLQDRAFRQALAFQRFTRKVARLREPFLLMRDMGRPESCLGTPLTSSAVGLLSSIARRRESTTWNWLLTTPTYRPWSQMPPIQVSWEPPASTTRTAKAYSHSRTRMRQTWQSPWRRRCFGRSCRLSRGQPRLRSPSGWAPLARPR
jgi:hypothetical protein